MRVQIDGYPLADPLTGLELTTGVAPGTDLL
jgi:hypothetical protein